MADASILEIGGNSYNIKDATARENIAALESGIANLGELAYKDTASGTFTPSGSVTVNETTDIINTITSVGTLPSSSYDSTTETLSFNSGALPTMSSATVMTGATASFTGTSGNVTVS